MKDLIELKWTRPEPKEFPKIWHTFKAKDIDSDELVEYRIQDIPESRKEEALKYMAQNFLKEEPLCCAYELNNDPDAIDDFRLVFGSAIDKNASLVCFKEGSDEIVGININFVSHKDDNLMENIQKRIKSVRYNLLLNMTLALLFDGFDTFEHYGVDKYLTSFGLYVVEKYRGRGVGEQLLRARKPFCEEFNIKLTSTAFSSNFANRSADKAGFKVDKSISFSDIRNHPEYELGPIDSDFYTIKSIVF